MDKFNVLDCMLIRETSLKREDSVYDMHLNFRGFFWRKKCTYTGQCSIKMTLVDIVNYIRNCLKFQTVIFSSSLNDTVSINDHCGA